ncbi:hypothetical protein NITHO_5930003 [Nitrolancea hollandica Lb]|uniref:Uncharacterized protein n=1 Tax=Nitrolancea hollandica Lb TaxID=1129897 RepID=I4EMD3_9BACT|nr:hypothetical protein NITHO_5930003 [Nitrolancea hollandica Lb]
MITWHPPRDSNPNSTSNSRVRYLLRQEGRCLRVGIEPTSALASDRHSSGLTESNGSPFQGWRHGPAGRTRTCIVSIWSRGLSQLSYVQMGGLSWIRTSAAFAPVLQTGPFNHSGTNPLSQNRPVEIAIQKGPM